MSTQEKSDGRKDPVRLSRSATATLILWTLVVLAAVYYAPKLGSVLRAGASATPGTESAVAQDVLNHELRGGDAQDLVVVLTGEKPVKDSHFEQEAKTVLDQIRQVEGVTRVRSYWDTGEESLIGKDGHSTVVLVEASVDTNEAQARLVPALRELRSDLAADMNLHVTGWAAVQADLLSEALQAIDKSHLLVVPAVLIVLLLIFGSVVAAAIPLGLGLISVGVTMGIFYFYAQVRPVDTTAPVVISMLGMGVGIDYSLFLVTRFREEINRGLNRAQAVRRTMTTAGKAIVFSGATVVTSVASLYIIKNPVFRSVTISMVLVVVISVLASVTLLPIVLYLLGPKINALSLFRRRRASGNGFWHRWALSVMRRPWTFALAAIVPLLLLAVPAWKISTGWPNVSLLTSQADARQGFTVLEEQFDAGMMDPVDVIIQVKDGTVADEEHLPKLYEVVSQIRQDPSVASVISHVSLDPEWDLDKYREIYIDKPSSLAGLTGELGGRAEELDQFKGALQEMRDGITAMSDQMPRSGPGDLQQLAAGLAQIRGGIQEVAAGLDTAGNQLMPLSDALFGISSYLAQAQADLDKMGVLAKSDPYYSSAYRNVATAKAMVDGGSEGPSLGAAVQTTAESLQKASSGLQQMSGNLQQMEAAVNEGSQGMEELATAAQGLNAMSDGLGQMITNLDQASKQLGEVQQESGSLDLTAAVNRGDFGLRVLMASGGKVTENLIPDLVNINRAADVARIMVIPKEGADSMDTRELIHRLRESIPSEDFASVLVGGPPAQQLDFSEELEQALPWVIGLVLTITFVVLLILLRSILLPLKAIIMNCLSVLAAYGVLVAVFQNGHLSNPLGFEPLGYVGTPTVVILFAVLFGLSMDYEVFLMSRIKEVHDETGDNELSVAVGLEQTASVITGAAAIMLVVFGAFVFTGMVTVKELGVGLFTAILLDATLIRIVLAPAFMRLMGEWNWWAPSWLLRILPDLGARSERV